MSLPKIDHPVFKLRIPSTKKSVEFRPMLVKEEKILLMTKEDGSNIMTAVKQIVNNCIMQDININELTIFDIEYLFLKIRALSINNMITITLKDPDDEETYEFEIDLNDIEIDMKEKKSNVIPIDDKQGLELRWPTAAISEEITDENIESEADIFDLFLADCLLKYYNEDSVHDFTKNTKKEKLEFIENNVSSKVFKKMQEFLNNTPGFNHVIEYKDKQGADKKITLKSLDDFFTF